MTEAGLLGGVTSVHFERQAAEVRNDIITRFQTRRDINMARNAAIILARVLMEHAAVEHLQARSTEEQDKFGEEAVGWLFAYQDAMDSDWEEMKIVLLSTAKDLAKRTDGQIDMETLLLSQAYTNLSASL